MKISLIYAQNEDRALGFRGNFKLPWHHKEDLQRFKDLTMWKPIIMGMSTFTSLPKPLPGRVHHVLTRKTVFHSIASENVYFHPDLTSALKACEDVAADEVFIIGGEHVLAEGLSKADAIYRTLVRGTILEGNLAMAPSGLSQFELIREETPDTNAFVTFQTFVKR